jgi:hypothetical protein
MLRAVPVTEALAHHLQFGHRQLAGAADIHCAKQGNEGGHGKPKS